jgi:hypothetical protein
VAGSAHHHRGHGRLLAALAGARRAAVGLPHVPLERLPAGRLRAADRGPGPVALPPAAAVDSGRGAVRRRLRPVRPGVAASGGGPGVGQDGSREGSVREARAPPSRAAQRPDPARRRTRWAASTCPDRGADHLPDGRRGAGERNRRSGGRVAGSADQASRAPDLSQRTTSVPFWVRQWPPVVQR